MWSKDYTIIMNVEMQYYGTGLKVEMKPTENLYIFIGWRQPEYALKYLELSTTKNNTRVLHKNICRNTHFTNKNKFYLFSHRHTVTVLYNRLLWVVLMVQ
jgi:hypothetical protein